ncbi:hypothetical protein M9H77_18733 [Catharanthus roseus]|uniref:Uncharacterized protein n=1 Tax=Catharanthus roseus TaxID=4058 RepID=A0ACC0B8A2_CATRO|nr:hypothetical protein M9H77_18733 [Catharanthus roseus]
MEEKKDEIEKTEETKEEMSSILFKGDEREEMIESSSDISSPLNSLSNEEVKLFTNSNNHFLACFSPSVQKFEAQNMENEGSLGYKLYKTISFLPSTYFLIQSQFLDFLTTSCGTKPNHGMKAKGAGMGKELSIGYGDKSTSLSLNPFLLCHVFSFKELKLFLELYVSYVTLVGNVMVNPFTCELALDVAHIFKSSSSCAYLEKQLWKKYSIWIQEILRLARGCLRMDIIQVLLKVKGP